MKRWMLIVANPRLALQIMLARVQSPRTRIQILFEVFDCINEVEA